MTLPTIEEADAEYKRMMAARETSALARYKALAGSPAAYQALLARTQALMHQEGWDPIEYLTEEERDAIN